MFQQDFIFHRQKQAFRLNKAYFVLNRWFHFRLCRINDVNKYLHPF